MSKPQTWRELLKVVISVPQVRTHIAKKIGVDPLTLVRWTKPGLTPRQQSLRLLPDAVPEYRERLRVLIAEEFPEVISVTPKTLVSGEEMSIPSELYQQVLSLKAYTAQQASFQTLCNPILEHALKQLDPYEQGMAITLASCLPPSCGQKVRSLRLIAGRGTAPWAGKQERLILLLGAESLLGYAVVSGHMQINQQLSDPLTLSPGYRLIGEESAVAVPIMYKGKIAGGLRVSCTRPDYFRAGQLTLIQQYAELLTVAFEQKDFYEPEQIRLGFFPHVDEQKEILIQFRQRVYELMKQAAREYRPLSITQAELRIWQQVEEELLQVAAAKKEYRF